MTLRTRWAVGLVIIVGGGLTGRYLSAQAVTPPVSEATFEKVVKPFLAKNCLPCHNSDVGTAGVRVDQLTAKFDDQQVKTWEGIRRRVGGGTMPPKGLPQPPCAERQRVTEWIARGLEVARLRPAPKNGLVRRLTVAQYRNTLRELLLLDDDLTQRAAAGRRLERRLPQ